MADNRVLMVIDGGECLVPAANVDNMKRKGWTVKGEKPEKPKASTKNED